MARKATSRQRRRIEPSPYNSVHHLNGLLRGPVFSQPSSAVARRTRPAGYPGSNTPEALQSARRSPHWQRDPMVTLVNLAESPAIRLTMREHWNWRIACSSAKRLRRVMHG